MYLSLLIFNLIFRIILESPQSGESPKPSHFKASKGHENPLVLFKLDFTIAILKHFNLSFITMYVVFDINIFIVCCQIILS